MIQCFGMWCKDEEVFTANDQYGLDNYTQSPMPNGTQCSNCGSTNTVAVKVETI